MIIAFCVAIALFAPLMYFTGIEHGRNAALKAAAENSQNETQAPSDHFDVATAEGLLNSAGKDCGPHLSEAEARERGCPIPINVYSYLTAPTPSQKPGSNNLNREFVAAVTDTAGIDTRDPIIEDPLSAALTPDGGQSDDQDLSAGFGFGANPGFVTPGFVGGGGSGGGSGGGPNPGPVGSGGPSGGGPTGGPSDDPTGGPKDDPTDPTTPTDPTPPVIVTPIPGAVFLFVSGIIGFFGIAWRPARR